MRIKRAVIVSALLALGLTGSVAAGAAVAAPTPTAQVHVVAGAHFHN